MRLLLLPLACIALLPACQTERTVLAGPATTSLDINDYDPNAEANRDTIAQKAAASGMVGSQFGGGSGWSQRFGNANPYGYGMNAMSEKMFGGDTQTRDMKSFTQTKDFLTKRYSNTRELGQKESTSQKLTSWLSGKKARTDQLASETGQTYRDAARTLDQKSSRFDGRTLDEKMSRESGRTARTKDFYPAKKVLDQGADKPKIISNADKGTADAVSKLVKSRSRDNPATVEDIRQLIGKSE